MTGLLPNWVLVNPDPREDLESRSPNLGPYTTKGTLYAPPLRDLLFGSSRGSGKGFITITKKPYCLLYIFYPGNLNMKLPNKNPAKIPGSFDEELRMRRKNGTGVSAYMLVQTMIKPKPMAL